MRCNSATALSRSAEMYGINFSPEIISSVSRALSSSSVLMAKA